VSATASGWVLAASFATAAVAPLLARWFGRNTGYALGMLYAAGGAILAAQAPAIVRGEPIVASMEWIPSLDVRLSISLDGLSLLFSLLILWIGAIVSVYSARYFSPGGSVGRHYGLMSLFAASMLGLVLSDNVIAMFVFWELTSITSFFLIGGNGKTGSKQAMRAFLVTGLGGLALLGGLLLMSVVAGSTSLREIFAGGSAIVDHAAAPAIMALIILGAFTKSAQMPFHFWLPGAMVAPTPVSTYLHSATMVKAGIYLLARMSPLFGGQRGWMIPIVLTGLITALAAAAAHTMAHALYKATLFMIVGVVDHQAGGRDIRELHGLGRMMPITATVAALAAMSMAGLPPFFGFVSKEESFGALLAAPGAGWIAPVAAALAVLASMLTFAYSARLIEGAFGGQPTRPLAEPPRGLLAPAAVTAVAGLVLTGALPRLISLLDRIAQDAVGTAGHVKFALWHGITPALGLSVITITGGLALYALRRRIDTGFDRVRLPASGTGSFDAVYDTIVAAGRAAGRPFISRAAAIHASWVLGAVIVAAGGAWLAYRTAQPPPVAATPGEDWLIVALIAVAAGAAIRARSRIAAVALIGATGFLIAVLYVLLGAPDLALTQLLVETLTVTLVVMVFRRLPRRFEPVRGARRLRAAGIAIVTGTLAGAAAYAFAGRRPLSDVAGYYLEAAEPVTGGSNVVNTILVDFRALDTLGEITVLAVAALGVYALVRLAKGGGA